MNVSALMYQTGQYKWIGEMSAISLVTSTYAVPDGRQVCIYLL